MIRACEAFQFFNLLPYSQKQGPDRPRPIISIKKRHIHQKLSMADLFQRCLNDTGRFSACFRAFIAINGEIRSYNRCFSNWLTAESARQGANRRRFIVKRKPTTIRNLEIYPNSLLMIYHSLKGIQYFKSTIITHFKEVFAQNVMIRHISGYANYMRLDQIKTRCLCPKSNGIWKMHTRS